jgi:uncharacterized protein (DUF1697 family)
MHIALLRGINVGGKHLLPMKDLTEIFVKAGCSDVVTYIQSGNVILSAPKSILKKLPEVVADRIAQRLGFEAPVILRSSEQLAKTIKENPFLLAGEPEKTLHVMFLADLPDPGAVASLDTNRSPGDRFHVLERDIYLHLPNGVARTKLSNAYFDSKLRTSSTGRNWATVLKLLELSSRL